MIDLLFMLAIGIIYGASSSHKRSSPVYWGLVGTLIYLVTHTTLIFLTNFLPEFILSHTIWRVITCFVLPKIFAIITCWIIGEIIELNFNKVLSKK